MTTSYLMVTSWQGEEIIRYPTDQKALIRRVEAQGTKARKFAQQYELRLNGGVDYTFSTGRKNLLKSLKEKSDRYSVTAIPDSQAREHNNYPEWMECKVYQP
jgi:hypothetical protein